MHDGQSITQIRVVNNNPFPIMDRYDGVQYQFPPEEPVTVPADVATHIFGYRPDATEQDMLLHVSRRFGRNTPKAIEDGEDRQFFENLDIKPVRFKLVSVEETGPRTPYPGEDGTVPPGSVRTRQGRPLARRGRPPLNKHGKMQLSPQAEDAVEVQPEQESPSAQSESL